jgi:hypothetical protein
LFYQELIGKFIKNSSGSIYKIVAAWLDNSNIKVLGVSPYGNQIVFNLPDIDVEFIILSNPTFPL